ncbi:MAG: glycosyltransferase family 9 protein [Parvularculaceae bacterium]
MKTDALAAFVNAEPYFEAIREAHPDARISLLTVEALQRVARAAPYFDHVAVAPNLNDADAKRAFVRQLREARFSRVYDLSGDDLARKIQAAFGVMGPKWLCAAPSGRRARDVVEALRAGPNAARLSSVGVEAPERLPAFTWALDARKDSANMKPSWFGVSGAFGLLLPGIDPERRWPARHYGEFARMMARGGVMPVIVGSRDIHGFADKIAEVAPEVVDLTGKADHLQLASLAREATFFVSDSAEEVELAVSVGCAGVLIKRLGEEDASPVGRHLMTLTVRHSMEEATPDFVWRSLRNMGLIPEEADRAMVLER